jgi:DNA-binding HxlR family transcriptional regulator
MKIRKIPAPIKDVLVLRQLTRMGSATCGALTRRMRGPWKQYTGQILHERRVVDCLKRLETNGHVRREPNPKDYRIPVYVPTSPTLPPELGGLSPWR